MKFIIEGREYAFDGIARISLWDLLELPKQTRAAGFSGGKGIDQAELQRRGQRMAAVAADIEKRREAGEPAEDQLDEEGIETVCAMIWLARRKAGERDLTVRDAVDFPLDQMDMIVEEGDDRPDPPRATPGGEPAAAAPQGPGSFPANSKFTSATAS